jgi:sugar phosphate isomerase/epimerase
MNRRSFLAATAALPLLATPLLARPARKFQLGLVTYNVAQNWDLATLLKNAQAAGIAAIECRTTHKHGVEPKLTGDERKAIKQQFRDSGVTFWGCGSVCEFHSDDNKVVTKNIEDCKQFLQLVADLGGRGVKVRPNGVVKGKSLEASLTQIGEALKPCGRVAADLGLEIWVEVHGAVTQVPKNMKTIMDVCQHPSVGVTWNSNPTDVVNGSVAEGFELLAKHIKSCHINDLGNDAKKTYPYRELFRLLAGINYERFTLIEVGKSVDADKGIEFLKDYKKQWEELAG